MAVDQGPETLAQRLVRAPLSADPEAARKAVDDWLAGAGEAGAVFAGLAAAQPLLRPLTEALADGSPFLWELIRRDPARFVTLLRSDPATRLRERMSETFRAAAQSRDDAEVMRLLRRLKAESALLIALADIGGVWPLEHVTRALSDLADTAVRAAVRHLLLGAMRAGKLVPPDPDHIEEHCGYVVFAMGKMGAHELNYSSDIDLIVFFDPTAPLAPGIEPALLFVRLTRTLIKLLQERTEDGYVFRVDLRLRPDPASTQVAVSVPAALGYYESIGQNWERAAFIKARPCAGDLALGGLLLKELTPFVWRKYLDFATLADVHAMKRQIHAYKGHGDIAVEGHNVKLGRGGIREIEFFVQTQQLIAGGRNPVLRGRETLAMLDVLADGQWIAPEAATELARAYCFLREVEHRLQMVADEQTHNLPSDRPALDRFARFLGFEGRDGFAQALLTEMLVVQRHYAALFEDAAARAAEQRGLSFPPDRDEKETLDKLGAMGFRAPLEVSTTVRRWLSGAPRGLRGETARNHFDQLVPMLLDQLASSENPDGAVLAFDHFLNGLHGGARLFALLNQNPDLVALVALLLGTAPRLADILAAHPQVMDPLIDPAFFGALPDAARLDAELERSLAQARSDEDFLDRVRLFGQEHMFLIGARILSGTVSAVQAGDSFAGLADVVIKALHRSISKSFTASYGKLAGGESAVLAMGKLGGREMTASSDLDLIVIYDFDESRPESDGPRSLYGSQYYARFTQRLINALTTQTNHGRLYDVDMRLRPSGRSGPVATSLAAFRDYQRTEAWTWEHLALTRARVVSASPAFTVAVERAIREVLCVPRDATAVAGDVVEMRRAIATEKGDDDRWNLKYVAGGLIDIEFIAQYLQLVHAATTPAILDTSTIRVLDKAARHGLLPVEEAEVLRPAARLFHDLTHVLRLCLGGPFKPEAAGAGLLALLTRAADVPDFPSLEAHLSDTQERVRASFVRILGEEP
ncbi:MAG: bifunctional [glutamine synthetase] adenylyltransferase/[glutamine synthetase]-adenylyl-L-tyrosine phosphorylase [Rhodoplanes sp.]|uniref:bifunctional [glutamine synthetase] adenylyltransferase/[glutamine synthetase]-adenylyl-L-tyrosine phosphorylase n=1 Tax=Rhodoplanes sp. TaxID=1968906 RepID=UPI00181ED6F2|nr:bifunctional [glutamine synthetase] adenylyltransferase/[glutamine synthetase]-adenylyl-L-tyrosine phosphorylase [Rhodoplanes sp.]NVO14459.1 bifunctional [glutamine synthetase] adenylyltransferase/[glutamine synthetase]-adenylyl-L-tyrosine phosphorylase [Rhodoplanes sp.]